jgi:hypothetical protein
MFEKPIFGKTGKPARGTIEDENQYTHISEEGYRGISRKINGKEVKLIVIFDGQFRKIDTEEAKQNLAFFEKYKECPDFLKFDRQRYTNALYSKDFKEFMEYQKKETLKANIQELKDNNATKEEIDEALKSETLFKFWKNIKYVENEISFDKFMDTTISIFGKILFYQIENNPEYVISDSLTIEIKMVKVKDMEFFFFYNHEASDIETACYYCSGLWFMQTIVMPFLIFQKVDFAFIERFVMHEFTHHLSFIKGYMVWDTKYQKKIKKFAKKKSAYNINYLYTSLFNLREEGLADFNARKNSNNLEIDMRGVKTYNENMVLLSKKRLKKYSQDFYEGTISTGDMTPSGEYTMGRNMCLIVAMAIAKKDKKPYSIIVNEQTHQGYDFQDLNKYLTMNTRILIKDLDKKVIDQAMGEIFPRVHYYFVKLYEGSCDELHIEEKNRIMTSRRFYKLVEQAIQTYKDERKQKLLKAGFINTPTDVVIDDKE